MKVGSSAIGPDQTMTFDTAASTPQAPGPQQHAGLPSSHGDLPGPRKKRQRPSNLSDEQRDEGSRSAHAAGRRPIEDQTLLPAGSRGVRQHGSDSARWSMSAADSESLSNPSWAIDLHGVLHPTPEAEALRHLNADPLRFPTGLTLTQLAEQQSLEREYVSWLVNKVILPRQAAFGEGHYTLDQHMGALGHEVLWPAAYQFVRQFLSSCSRSPVRNAITTATAPQSNPTGASGELFTNHYDPAVVGGAAGGTTAYLADAVLTAMDRRARLANMPSIKAVDVKALVPDPGSVVLKVINGAKHYARVDSPGGPLSADLHEQVKLQRDSLNRWQSVLSGKVEGMLMQPMFAGAMNALRRKTARSDQEFTVPLQVFAGSLWASGTGGALAKGSIELLKGAPWIAQARIENHVGGTQTANLFSTSRLDPARPAPGARDLWRLPQFGLEVAKESWEMLAHTVNAGQRSWTDLALQASDVVRHAFCNIFASVTSPGVGTLLAQLSRGPSSGPLPGESARSDAYVLQQFGQSGMNDLIWQVFKQATDAGAYDLGAAVDRRRKRQMQEFRRDIAQALARVADLAAGSSAPDAPDPDEWPDSVSQQIARLSTGQPQLPSLDDLKGIHAELAAWRPADEPSRRHRSELLRALAQAMEPMMRLEAIQARSSRTRPASS